MGVVDMPVPTKEVFTKFSIKVIGDHEFLTEFEKDYLNDKLFGFIKNYRDGFTEGVLTADVRLRKGTRHKGKYRGVPLVYLALRLATDKGHYLVSKENYGLQGTLSETIEILTNKVRNINQKYDTKRTVPIEPFDLESMRTEI